MIRAQVLAESPGYLYTYHAGNVQKGSWAARNPLRTGGEVSSATDDILGTADIHPQHRQPRHAGCPGRPGIR